MAMSRSSAKSILRHIRPRNHATRTASMLYCKDDKATDKLSRDACDNLPFVNSGTYRVAVHYCCVQMNSHSMHALLDLGKTIGQTMSQTHALILAIPGCRSHSVSSTQSGLPPAPLLCCAEQKQQFWSRPVAFRPCWLGHQLFPAGLSPPIPAVLGPASHALLLSAAGREG